MGTSSTSSKSLFIIIFVCSMLFAIWLTDDGTIFPKSKGGSSSSKEEAFVSSDPNPQGCSRSRHPSRDSNPETLDLPGVIREGSLAYTASPASFVSGGTKNPEPGIEHVRHLTETPPDPQRLSLLLQHRTREDILLACKSRQSVKRFEATASHASTTPHPYDEMALTAAGGYHVYRTKTPKTPKTPKTSKKSPKSQKIESKPPA